MEKITDFTEGKILKPLIMFSLPILAALFLQAMYGAADLMIVGQFADTAGVSAVSTGSQVMQMITGIVSGLTMGTTVLIGQKIGQKNLDDAGKTIGASVCLFLIIAAVITAVFMIFAGQIATLMQAPAKAYKQTVDYILICSVGTVFIVSYNLISGILRGMGNSRLPLLFVGVACIVNIVLDLLFVAVFKWNSAGAAAATVIAQAASVFFALAVIKKRGLAIPFSLKDISFNKEEIIGILKLGSPIALQDALTTVSFLIITAILNALGLIASAAVGVCEKLVIFIMLVPIAYMSSISAFVAQNIGAGKGERAKKAMYSAMGTSVVFGVLMFCLSFFRGDLLASIFTNDPAVIAAAAEYMKAYAIDALLVSVLFCYTGLFNGAGQTMFVMVQGLIATFFVRIPYSYFVSKIAGVTMLQIGFASPVATIISVIMCISYYCINKKKIIA